MLQKSKPSPRRAGPRIILIIPVLVICVQWVLCGDRTWAQQQPAVPSVIPQLGQTLYGGAGWTWLSQFTNPALVGALYETPEWPLTGYYPLYPGGFQTVIPDEGVLVGPLNLHPFVGIAQMYTDNVFRTNTNRQSDFFTTLGPGIQAQLPFGGSHALFFDYRTNIQYYSHTPSNDVQDQTVLGKVKLDFPGGLKVDLGGEHKLGHDPRGSAVDTQAIEVNKWTANSLLGQAEYVGAQSGIRLNVQSTRWNFLNNSQGIIRDRLSNYAGLTFSRDVTGKTAALANVAVIQEIYDQNQNLDSVIYQINGGIKWNVSELTSGQILLGFQYLKFTRAQVNQPPPLLSQFTREKDAYPNFFVMGNLDWKPTSLLTISLQPYRTVQQTAVLGALFFVATGVNLTARHTLTNSTTLTFNLGLEQDQFTSASGTTGGDRTDLIKNVALGVNYRAVKWLGLGFQYIFEDRGSTQEQFNYYSNTFMISAQAMF